MSRTYATDEQYERWYTAECCRCGRRKHKAGHRPDGYVCRNCPDRAGRTRGTCPGCEPAPSRATSHRASAASPPTFPLHTPDEGHPTSPAERERASRRPRPAADRPGDTETLRVAGVIVLLYAQPLTRIVRLTIDDVLRDADAVLLRLGEPASPVPAPVDSLLLEHIAHRDDVGTATNRASRWLFPGRRAGRSFRPDRLSAPRRAIGVQAVSARGAAVRRQLLELPAPGAADALGHHDKTTSRLPGETGGTWNRYTVGDHSRSQDQPRW